VVNIVENDNIFEIPDEEDDEEVYESKAENESFDTKCMLINRLILKNVDYFFMLETKFKKCLLSADSQYLTKIKVAAEYFSR